ncbi:DNA end protector [Tenacibaculum phage pT24]|uniref:DNA end protector n=1 Tax=Tenacibaculum phage pT24 TaxID=1880590 RepID=A0A1B4XWS7_9CAUD|nr:DNA end protector [Tenacibaculum phage pT24]BAV39270.1 DNA end protector [Tenacibaculum phage pT24]
MAKKRFSGIKNIRSRFDRFINAVSQYFNQKGYTDDYNMWDSMHNNEIGSIRNRAQRNRKAVEWFNKYLRTDPKAKYQGKMLEPSMLYMFNYDTPKYEDVLDFYDTQPLVLCIGQKKTKLGVREVGINLHLLPPKIRQSVLFMVYKMYKIQYNKAMKQGVDTVFYLDWRTIKSMTKQLGVEFAVRMYIPSLRKKTVKFPHIEWERAIWLPSKEYKKINEIELEREWKKFITKGKTSATRRLASKQGFNV